MNPLPCLTLAPSIYYGPLPITITLARSTYDSTHGVVAIPCVPILAIELLPGVEIMLSSPTTFGLN